MNSSTQAHRGPDGSSEEVYRQAWSLVSASQSPELWGWGGRARERQVLQGQSEGGVGGKLFETQFRTPAFLGKVILVEQNCRSGCLKEVGTEGGWGWGSVSISKPHLCGSAVFSRYEVSRHSYRFPSAFRSWAQSDGEKEVGRVVSDSHSTHISFVQ